MMNLRKWPIDTILTYKKRFHILIRPVDLRFMMALDQNRVFYAYSYLYKSVVDKLKSGDTISISGGIDFPLIDYLSFLQSNKGYAITTGQIITESQYDGTGLNDGRILLDLTLGLIWRKWDLRGGLSLPIVTLADNYSNSDRLISLDVGFRWGIR